MIKMINKLSAITDNEKLSELNEVLMEDIEARNEFACYIKYCGEYID